MNAPTPDGPVGGSRELPPLQGDGLPTLPTGEPVLARWFVLTMLLLAPIAIAVTVWAFLSIPAGETVPPAERRPPGDASVTIDRGDAELGASTETEPGPGCGEQIDLVGDEGAREAGRRAVDALCNLLGAGGYPQAREGLREWNAADGQLRFATFEVAAVESSARFEDDRVVIELNARYLFEDARRAAPTLLHQLVLISDPGWPGETVSAETELAAAEAHADACDRLDLGQQPPVGCQDVRDLLNEDDPLGSLVDAGFRL
jgi:hypothetical protein